MENKTGFVGTSFVGTQREGVLYKAGNRICAQFACLCTEFVLETETVCVKLGSVSFNTLCKCIMNIF